MKLRPRALVLALVLFTQGCSRGREATASDHLSWFEDEAQERGLSFQLHSGHQERFHFPEIMCGGGALFDMDSDGDLDAYLVQADDLTRAQDQRRGNQLFENSGQGEFRDISPGSGAQDKGYGMGVAVGDCDQDGDPDLYVTNVGENTLLANQGQGQFLDRSDHSRTKDASWSVSTAFFDFDLDGDLDLFVTNYIYWTLADDMVCQGPLHGFDYCSPKTYNAPAPDTLYRNEGDGVFEDVSRQVGLRTAFGNGLGVVVADFDLDGWPDVFVANDGTMNQLWMNQKGAAFEDEAMARGVAVDDDGRAKAGMGVCVCDLDDDGDEELLVVNLEGESDSYYRNDGDHFSDRTPVVKLARPSRGFTRFGVGLHDFDHDGYMDLYQANGRVVHPPKIVEADPFAEVNLLLRGGPGPRFEAVRPRDGTALPRAATSRAAVFGDVDGDGAIDILVVNRDSPSELLINTVPRRGNSIRLRLQEEVGRASLGAILRGRAGERAIMRTLRSAYSYCAASEAVIHLGLGERTTLDEVEIEWPGGDLETFGSLKAGTTHVLVRGSGQRQE